MAKAPRKTRAPARAVTEIVAVPVELPDEASAGQPALVPSQRQVAVTAAPVISVAICTYERYDLLEGVLRAVSAQAEGARASPAPFEILLVDNSADPDRSFVEYRRHRHTPRLRWIHEPQKGLSCARNRAIAESSAPFLAFLDDDAIPEPGWLGELLAGFTALGGNAAMIGGRVSPLWLGRRPDWLSDQLLAYLSITDLGERLRILGETEWVVGANMALRRAVLEKVGPFPVHLGRKGSGASLLSNEETALMRDIRAAGGLIGYAPRAQVGHLIDPARLSQGWFRRRLAWQAVSDYLDGDGAHAVPDQNWDWLTGFLVELPPSQRSFRGLLADMPSTRLFEGQLGAVYNAVTCLLSGAELSDGEATPLTLLGRS